MISSIVSRTFLPCHFVASSCSQRGKSPENGGSPMTFDEMRAQVLGLLQREQRVSYRALKRRFDLDDEYLEDLKDEIIKAKRLATDEEGSVLVWTGDPQTVTAHADQRPQPLAAQEQHSLLVET